MDSDNELSSFIRADKSLNASNRPVRLKLFHRNKAIDDILLPQFVSGAESICNGFEYHIHCVATSFNLPLKEFIGVPASLEFVTDRGQTRSVSGLVAQAYSGECDGAIASYRLVVRDALAIMKQRVNTRVFRRLSWPQVVSVVLDEWRQINPVLASNFDFEFAPGFRLDAYPEREQTIQFNESDSAFVQRLLRRSGIAWFFRPGRSRAREKGDPVTESTVGHTLVLFDGQSKLEQNEAGVVRYHRDDATEQRDSVTRWGAVRKLRAGNASIFSWDYKQPGSIPWMTVGTPAQADQGESGNRLARALEHFVVESPHVAEDHED